jgi:hypothetical protein
MKSNTGIPTTNVSTIKVTPNPAKDFINISGLSGGETLRISDIAGTLVLLSKIENTQQQIDISRLKAGIYIVQISKGGQTQSVKLIVKP